MAVLIGYGAGVPPLEVDSMAQVLELVMQMAALQASLAARVGDPALAVAALDLTERVVVVCAAKGYLTSAQVETFCGLTGVDPQVPGKC